MGEGNTPFVTSRWLTQALRINQIYFKLESSNPTGSFKDRFVAAELSNMLRNGQKICLATSSGNTGSSLAAYCARYGIECHLFVNEEVPEAKLAQIKAYEPHIYRVRDFGIGAESTLKVFSLLQELASAKKASFVVSAYRYCPKSMDGLVAMSQEVVGQLGGVPDHVFVPVGGGGLLTGVWRGFKLMHERSQIDHLPRVHAVQPTGNPTVHSTLSNGDRVVEPVLSTTKISGLSVPLDIDASRAAAAVSESKGIPLLVADEDIWKAQRLLCRYEGIYAEPAGATSVAGLIEAATQGWVDREDTVVCLITGHGLKDPHSLGRGKGTGVRIIRDLHFGEIPRLDLESGTPRDIRIRT